MEVQIGTPSHLFNRHLSKLDNKHILFSAPFGYGKSYFLEKFFKVNADYRAFWLSPVKYVVGSNEDIFEYIKLDLAIQLLLSDEFKNRSTPVFSEDLYIHRYLLNNPYDVAKLLFQTIKDLDIPGIKQGSALILNGLKTREEYLKSKKEFIKSTKSDSDKLLDFISAQHEVKGSIFEDDVITKIIRLALQAIKYIISDERGEQSNITLKQNVLIIDDFDRLDPEHIFRILNILSVHQNYTEQQNKFGFDKIIIVCSVDNIEKIYEHKYGKGVDFQGYMGKFYSTDIFRFNNQLAIAEYCRNEFSTELNDDSLKVLGLYLAFFVSKSKLSIRNIIKHETVSTIENIEHRFFFPEDIDKVDDFALYRRSSDMGSRPSTAVWGTGYKSPIKIGINRYHIDLVDFPFFKIVQILTTIFGDYNILKSHVNELEKGYVDFSPKDALSVVRTLVPLMHFIINFENKVAIFSEATMKQHEAKTHNNIIQAKTYDLPSFKALEKPITIPVGWNKEHQYDGTLSYYANVSKNFLEVDDYSTFQSSLSSQLMHFLKQTLNFIESGPYLNNLGLTN